NLADNGCRVVRYNQFGRGLSDRPRGVYGLDRYVMQLHELLESQGWDKANIIGHSMGGVVAAGFAEAFPESVNRVVLISPGLHMALDNSGITLIRLPVLGDIAAKTVLPSILSNRAEDLFINAGTAEADRYSQAFRRQVRYAGFSRSVKSLFRHDVVEERSDTYSALGAFETLLIHGTEDESVPQTHFNIIANQTSAERIVLPGIGHMPNMEVPDEVNSLIVGFLQER
ncbi:MAG: alpha/beta hydrolase, partial [Spirochaetaceae bacterium]|nr:alpha/beta hydrolase [Spirochaetaceae bacterium]